MTTSRRYVAALACGVLTTGVMVLGAQQAMAYPQNCTGHTFYDEMAWSECDGGSGSHRVVARCANGLEYIGRWVGTSEISTVDCPGAPFAHVVGVSVELQGD